MLPSEVTWHRQSFLTRILNKAPHGAVVNVTYSTYTYVGDEAFISAITIIRKDNKVRFFFGSVYAENVVGTLNLSKKYVERDKQFESAYNKLDGLVDDFFGM